MAPSLDRIRAFAFDIDGVMTQGGILCDSTGEFLRIYDAKDGFAIRMAVLNGYTVGIITGGSSDTIRQRFIASGVSEGNMFLHSRDKVADFRKFCAKNALKPEEVMYFGDDLPDIPVMKICGVSVAPSDAADEVREIAGIVSEKPGGKGCIRSAFELVMKSQGRWNFNVEAYKKRF